MCPSAAHQWIGCRFMFETNGKMGNQQAKKELIENGHQMLCLQREYE